LNLPKAHPLAPTRSRAAFGENLLEWYDEHQRVLPWRQQPSLYKTVVSEFMLQQTRVATALPYFERWLKKFPDFASLAASSEEVVVKAWEGLGYYSRARNLRKLAQQIDTLEEIPTDSKSWESFPGIGPYVAAAVTSINFGTQAAVVDGNVVRVLCRLLSVDKEYRDGASAQRELRPVAQKLLNPERPGDYNQAIMELGATVCHRQAPVCTVCPIVKFCHSGSRGDAERFPRIAKRKTEKVSVDRLWITRDSCLLLHETPTDSKRLAGLMELPRTENLPTLSKPKKKDLITIKKRAISNQSIEERIHRSELPEDLDLEDYPELRFVPLANLDEITLSGPHRRWLLELATKK
tara:strand:+ start:990 stop:2042 length:1053 start_codon:yes stop_codon:yes gene_type:complete